MPTGDAQQSNSSILDRSQLDLLFGALAERGYHIVGPRVRDGAIVYDDVASSADLPVGWKDEQDGGKYRLVRRNDEAVFGYAVGPHSWKRYLHPPLVRLWQATRKPGGFEVTPEPINPQKTAFIGVRSCEIHAIQIQDKVFLGGPHVDVAYKARRENAFLVALNCGQAGGTCFCVSMKTGPKAQSGFDLALTEVIEKERHYFLLEAGSDAGVEVLSALTLEPAGPEELAAAERVVKNTAAHMGRALDTDGIKDLLYRNYENPRWDQVANRCLTCANCTMVCPTCFCTTVEDVTDLGGEHAERRQKWDSCFTLDFSYIHGGSVRPSARSRYRQWMTHKLGTWIDQFGTSGCVGCGRCITWCPVGIDITEETRAIRESETAPKRSAREDANGD